MISPDYGGYGAAWENAYFLRRPVSSYLSDVAAAKSVVPNITETQAYIPGMATSVGPLDPVTIGVEVDEFYYDDFAPIDPILGTTPIPAIPSISQEQDPRLQPEKKDNTWLWLLLAAGVLLAGGRG